jgi:hypothetical protein
VVALDLRLSEQYSVLSTRTLHTTGLTNGLFRLTVVFMMLAKRQQQVDFSAGSLQRSNSASSMLANATACGLDNPSLHPITEEHQHLRLGVKKYIHTVLPPTIGPYLVRPGLKLLAILEDSRDQTSGGLTFYQYAWLGRCSSDGRRMDAPTRPHFTSR